MTRFFQFLLLVLVTAVLFYLFVYLQWGFVSNPLQFIVTIVSLVAASFFVSAIEAGLTVADKDGAAFDRISDEATLLARSFEYFDGRDPATFSKSEIRKYQRQLKKVRALRQKEDALTDSAKDEHIGAFSTLGTILTVAIAALISASAATPPTASSFVTLNLPLPTPMPDGVSFNVKAVDLTSVDAFTLVAATFPTLLVGKIVPKMVGRRFPIFFAYQLYPLARWVHLLLGWFPAGAKWPLTPLLRQPIRRE